METLCGGSHRSLEDASRAETTPRRLALPDETQIQRRTWLTFAELVILPFSPHGMIVIALKLHFKLFCHLEHLDHIDHLVLYLYRRQYRPEQLKPLLLQPSLNLHTEPF